MSATSNKIPVGELTVCHACCCSITGCSCKYPDCVGCGVDGIVLCMKSNMSCCKMLDKERSDEGKCFICTEGGLFLVTPTTCCQQQNQLCCLDSRCALPCTAEVPCLCSILPGCVVYPAFGCCTKVKHFINFPAGGDADGRRGKEDMHWDLSDVPVGEVRVCQACCCSICGFIFQYPACCGVKIEGIACCCQCEESCCKPIQEVNDDRICCICCDGGQYCVMPTTCISVTETCFCVDSRCAFPCTDKVPCICTLLPCCVVCASKEVKFGCFPKVSDVIPGCEEIDIEKVAPAQMEMY